MTNALIIAAFFAGSVATHGMMMLIYDISKLGLVFLPAGIFLLFVALYMEGKE
jgi:TctA family transporter